MANNKNSFLLYCDIITTIEKLPDDLAGKLFKHILNYVNDNDPECDDLLLSVAFEPIKQSLKRDLKKYEKRAETARANGLKGGRPKTQTKAKKPKETQSVNLNPRKAVSVSVSVSDSVRDKEQEHMAFDDFYLNYPKKTTKAEAMDYWNKKMNNQERQLAIDGIKNHTYGKEKAFITDPIRYLKHKRWEDEAINHEKSWQYNQSAKNQKLQESNQSIYERASQLEREASEEERSGLSETMGYFANALPEPKL